MLLIIKTLPLIFKSLPYSVSFHTFIQCLFLSFFADKKRKVTQKGRFCHILAVMSFWPHVTLFLCIMPAFVIYESSINTRWGWHQGEEKRIFVWTAHLKHISWVKICLIPLNFAFLTCLKLKHWSFVVVVFGINTNPLS